MTNPLLSVQSNLSSITVTETQGKKSAIFEIDPKAQAGNAPYEAPDLFETVNGKKTKLFTDPSKLHHDLNVAQQIRGQVQHFMMVARLTPEVGQDYTAFLGNINALIKYEAEESSGAAPKGTQKVTAATARSAKGVYEAHKDDLGDPAKDMPFNPASKIIERTPRSLRNPDFDRTVRALFPTGAPGQKEDPNAAPLVWFEVTESTIAGMRTNTYGPFLFRLKEATAPAL